MPKATDLTGEKFGTLTVTRRVGKDAVGAWLWESKCECGIICVHSSAQLKYRASCGCKTQENRVKHSGRGELHRLSKTIEYKTWTGIKRRCGHLNNGANPEYTRKGIMVCERWLNSFTAFLLDMGPRPSTLHTIDRIKNDRGYEPGNCRWATMTEQANNRSSTIVIEHNGVSAPLADWCRKFGVARHTAHFRLKSGAPFEQIFRQPMEMQTVPVGKEMVTIPECAKRLGMNRESAYRLHRAGKLVPRLNPF